MPRCTETMPWHGDVLQCEADVEVHTTPIEDGGDPRHYATLINEREYHDDGEKDPDFGKPYVTRWHIPD